MIVTYQKEQIPEIWPLISQHVCSALSRGSIYTPQDIKAGLEEGRFQAWTYQTDKIDATLITAIQIQHDIQFCLLLALAGKNMHQWIAGLRCVDEWARENGCAEMRIHGRKGWARYLDYETVGRDGHLYIMRKKL